MIISRLDIQTIIDICPNWVNWIAQDADGTWWGYEIEPLQHDKGWYENEVGQCVKLKSMSPNTKWYQMCFAVNK